MGPGEHRASALAELRPNEREPFQQLVQVTRRTRGGTAAAVTELERLAEAAPRSPWPLLELANLYDEQGESAKAEAARLKRSSGPRSADRRRQESRTAASLHDPALTWTIEGC